MEIRSTDKGRGIFATKNYRPLDEIFREKAIFYTCVSKPLNLSDISAQTLSYINTFPNDAIDKFHGLLKAPVLMLQQGYDLTKIANLAQTVKPSIPKDQVKKISEEYNIKESDIQDLVNICITNSFGIHGIFYPRIGYAIFHQGSFFNHSCIPNTLSIITTDTIIVYAAREIKTNEEITIRYSYTDLGFNCKCGHCHLLPQYTRKDQKYLSGKLKPRINHFMEQCKIHKENRIYNSFYISALIAAYSQYWVERDQGYREEDLCKLLQDTPMDIGYSWFLSQLILLCISKDKQYSQTKQRIFKLITDEDIRFYIRICSELTPHLYHNKLIEAVFNDQSD